MEEIKIDEYIRLDNGEIGKVIDIKENPQRVVYSEYGEIALCSSIVKHSKELIDLVKSGDIIEYRELKTSEKYGTIVNHKYISDIHDNEELDFIKEEIKTRGIELISILTKEMYAQHCYKVGGEE